MSKDRKLEARIYRLGVRNQELNKRNRGLEKIKTEAQKVVDAFERVRKTQDDLLGHGIAEACENWDAATLDTGQFDLTGLMLALENDK